jgi:hypothetical protein
MSVPALIASVDTWLSKLPFLLPSHLVRISLDCRLRVWCCVFAPPETIVLRLLDVLAAARNPDAGLADWIKRAIPEAARRNRRTLDDYERDQRCSAVFADVH